jgi:RHS repeat-associated protein
MLPGEIALKMSNFDYSERIVGDKFFELAEHRGNVLNVITDRKIVASTPGTPIYTADVVSYSDYSPYGTLLDNRHGDESGRATTRGFQGQEGDPELKGEGNSWNYKYRMHDPRIGRFFAVDPLAPQYPHNSPYAFSENKVIAWIELEGLESYFSPTMQFIGKIGSSTEVRIVSSKNLKQATKHIKWAIIRENAGKGDSKSYRYDNRKARELSFDKSKAKTYHYRTAKFKEQDEIVDIHPDGGFILSPVERSEEGVGTQVPLIFTGVSESKDERYVVWFSNAEDNEQGINKSVSYDSYEQMLNNLEFNENGEVKDAVNGNSVWGYDQGSKLHFNFTKNYSVYRNLLKNKHIQVIFYSPKF